MTGSELQRGLSALGFLRIGISADARYDVWVRAGRGRRPARRIVVPNADIVDDFVASRILADAAR